MGHQIWSYGPLKSTIFHGFGLRGWIRAGISPEPYKLWTWNLHHWIQQRWGFKRMCRNIVTTPSDLELWAPEVNRISWIWLVWVNSCWHISRTLQATDTETCTIGYSKYWGLKGCVEILWQPHQIWSYGPINQLRFMDLVRMGEFVLAYLPNPTSYGHETCTIGYSKDWGLKGCVEILWHPQQIWSYEPLNSTMFHSFSSRVKSCWGFRCWRLEITPSTMELCACKKKIHVSSALVHVCMKFLIKYTDGVDE